ncbi:hypothetical protein [Tenacibaculum maritimum]|nr:hypothetical protein [Tenacibaculum maritimum]
MDNYTVFLHQPKLHKFRYIVNGFFKMVMITEKTGFLLNYDGG